MEPNDQVAHPDFGHMEVFHDFLRIWVQFVDRLECCEAMLFEQYMTAKCIQAIDENKFVRPGFDDVKNVILYLKKNYDLTNTKSKFMLNMIKSSGIFSFAMIPSKTAAELHTTDKNIKNFVKVFVREYVEFNIVDDIVKQHEAINKTYSMGQPKAKKSKEAEEAAKTAIIESKTMEMMMLIQDHVEEIIKSDNPPIENLDFAGVLPPVRVISTKFVDYWKTFKDSRLSLMVLSTARALPTSALSEQVFSKAEFQEQTNQDPQTLEERTRLQYAHLNGKVFNFDEK